MNEFWAHRHTMIQDIPYGEDAAQRMDIYVQGAYIGEPNYFAKSNTPKPTLVYIHGGGWLSGTKETRIGFLMPFIQKGWNVVNVEYRLGLGTAPNAAEDVLKAMQWIAENAETYGIDKQNIVVSGESAGGHLALLAGLVNSKAGSHPAYVGDDLKIKAIIDWFGITDIEKVSTYLSANKPEGNYALGWIGQPQKLATISKTYSPIHYITKNAPPILSIHGVDDSVVPYSQSVLLHEALDKVGTQHRLLSLKGGKHMGFTEEQFQLIYEAIFEFIE